VAGAGLPQTTELKMDTINVTLTDLTFPAKLEDKFCKFRPLISIKYTDSNDKIMFAREALPGLGKRDYWECEKGNKNKADYVRHDSEPKVDMNKVGISRREITFSGLDVKKLERVDLELFDVDIKSGFFDTFKDNLLRVLPVAATPFFPATVPITLTLIKAAVEQGTNKKVSDLQKSVIEKAIGKEDGAARSIFVQSQDLTSDPKQTVTLTGPGVHGDYSVSLEIAAN
jgi:hypothetical protein